VNFSASSAWPHRATNPSLNKGGRVGLTISLLGHSALLAVVICTASTQLALPALIPITVVTTEEAEALEPQLSLSEQGVQPSATDTNGRWSQSSSQPEDAQTLVVAKLEEATSGAEPGAAATQYPPLVDPQSAPGVEAETSATATDPENEFERSLSNTPEAAGVGGAVNFREEKREELTAVKITRRTDWQANPVEDNKLTYSAPGSAVRLTVREASSAGFAETDFTRGFGLNNDETSGPLGLTPAEWGANAMAKSQRVDWTLVNLKSFGMTAFGYQSEVGRNFEPFGQTKKEFATPGTSTIKAGGEVRVGAFSFGLAQSSVANTEESVADFSAVEQEASVALDLPHLLQGTQWSRLLPTIRATGSTRHTPTLSQDIMPNDTFRTGFGGIWTWNFGYANLGYWTYSSAGREAVATSAWSGHGFDASFGAYYSSFGIDADLSYGYSEDIAPSWQSAGDLYNSSVTVSYKPQKLPGLWASAAAGNYNQNSMVYGGSPDAYGLGTYAEYWSVSAGFDLTTMFWSTDDSGSGASAKLLYRYTDNLSLDTSVGPTQQADNLVALMVQRKF
jgi:hypothetical protein